MKRFTTLIAAMALLISVVANAAFPAYYPKEGFQRVGILDDVQLQRQMIVVNDVPYSLADSVIVHSPTSYSVPASQLQRGTKIGYKMASGGRLIMEIWLLPRDYKNPRERR